MNIIDMENLKYVKGRKTILIEHFSLRFLITNEIRNTHSSIKALSAETA